MWWEPPVWKKNQPAYAGLYKYTLQAPGLAGKSALSWAWTRPLARAHVSVLRHPTAFQYIELSYNWESLGDGIWAHWRPVSTGLIKTCPFTIQSACGIARFAILLRYSRAFTSSKFAKLLASVFRQIIQLFWLTLHIVSLCLSLFPNLYYCFQHSN